MAKRRQMAEMNVVPYIDVMLVLLVIFMVTAPMLKQGVEVDLPRASNDPVSTNQDSPPLIVSVDRKGELYLNVGENVKQSKAIDEIQTLVAKALKAKPNRPVMVAGDHSIDYGKVIDVMTSLQEAGAPKVGLLTEPPVL